MTELTERQLREKEYYDEYASSFDLNHKVDFAPVIGPMTKNESRPWNSYWAIYELALKYFKDGHKLLDFGSGPGDNALRFSKIGYTVSGFDISEKNVEVATKLFHQYDVSDKGSFKVSSAESLDYADNSFDTIIGIDILHHVDIPKAMIECKRVLKTGGVAIFREPLEVPLLDFIRNLKIVKYFAPTEKSFELHITEDERKLNQYDIVEVKKCFSNVEIKRYFFFARFDKFYRKGSDPKPSLLEKLDHFLMKTIPGLKYLGGVVIFIIKK